MLNGFNIYDHTDGVGIVYVYNNDILFSNANSSFGIDLHPGSGDNFNVSGNEFVLEGASTGVFFSSATGLGHNIYANNLIGENSGKGI